MRTVILPLLILISSLSLHAQPIEHAAPISDDYIQQMDIYRFIDQAQIHQLGDPNERFITLLKEQETGFIKGTVFLFPDINQSLLTQVSRLSLYQQLPQHGWNALLAPLPAMTDSNDAQDTSDIQPPNEQPEAATTDEDNADQQSEQPGEQQNEQIKLTEPSDFAVTPSYVISQQQHQQMVDSLSKRSQLTQQLASQSSGYYVYVCHGKSCVWLMEGISNQQINPPDALIMLSAHIPNQQLNRNFNLKLAQSEFPILDIYQDADSPWVSHYLRDRHSQVKRQFKTDYRRRKLTSAFHYQGQQRRTVKEILGFLYAVGM